jgi:hypothetical protein
MSARFGILLPLWNHAADGGSLLDLAAGEVGLDHVAVPAVSGPQSHFRFGSSPDAPYFQTEGGWHYPPTASLYSASGLRPPRARWLGRADALARLREHVGRLDLELVLRLELRGVPAMIERHPHLVQRNAWGQEVPSGGACPCDPSLRELLRATFEDLARYEPAGFELVDWIPDVAADRSDQPLDWHPAARRLLDICFCASCRQVAERAGIDPESAARSVRVQVQRLLHLPPPGRVEAEEDPVVSAYVGARVLDCGEWLSRLAAGDPTRRYHLVCDFGQHPLYRDRAGLGWLVRVPGCRRVDQALWDGLLRDAARMEGLSLPVWRPAFDDSATLVRLVSDATRAGMKTFDLEGLDQAAPQALTWAKQAVRFARRGQ